MKLKILRYLCAFLLLTGLSYPVIAQGLRVVGKVTNQTGDPLAGATVTINGTTQSTATDNGGNFSITVPRQGSVLTVTYLGMNVNQVTVTGNDPVRVVMQQGAASALSEV